MRKKLSTVLGSNMKTLRGIGFLFGAGASFEAGYPLMDRLTRSVYDGLADPSRELLNATLAAEGKTYKADLASPNIEDIANIIEKRLVSTQEAKYDSLNNELRALVVREILSVDNPDLDNHIRFLKALKNRAGSHPTPIWIFTTNYDLLFEKAAAIVGIPIETGFTGAVDRYFDFDQFSYTTGLLEGQRFKQRSGAFVRLIKLHGSISWIPIGNQIYEQHPKSIPAKSSRTMILPRRQKIIESLDPPFHNLLTLMHKALGRDCKNLISCGFSYSDEHINERILEPKLRDGEIKLVALNDYETEGLSTLREYPALVRGTSIQADPNDRKVVETDLWKFSELASALEEWQ